MSLQEAGDAERIADSDAMETQIITNDVQSETKLRVTTEGDRDVTTDNVDSTPQSADQQKADDSTLNASETDGSAVLQPRVKAVDEMS